MSERTILMTGFPGFIARRLLTKLLSTDDSVRATVLVEAKEESKARALIAKMADRDTSEAPLGVRVDVVVGDITAMDCGLSGPEFRGLSENASEVFHLAAINSLAEDRRKAELVNVHGTANVLALARAMRRLERFVHFSSAYVSGDRSGVIMEDELDRGQGFRNSYESTKHQAELLVRRAGDRIPVTLVRPAGVVGDSRTGEIDRFDTAYHLGMLLVASPVAFAAPFPGEGNAPLNLVPVDYLVDAVHAIVGEPDTIGMTFHVVDPNPLSTRRVYETIAERAGRKLPKFSVSANVTKALLRIPGLERLAPISHHAIDYLNNMAFYNSRNTLSKLEGTGIRCPHFESYVENLMQYVRDYFEHAGRWKDTEGRPEERP